MEKWKWKIVLNCSNLCIYSTHSLSEHNCYHWHIFRTLFYSVVSNMTLLKRLLRLWLSTFVSADDPHFNIECIFLKEPLQLYC